MYVLPLARILIQQLNLFGVDVYNKVDAISLEQMDKLAREEHTVVISCEMDLK
jgi:ribosome-interacting GTPase 1